jgi:hypothetical protein
MFIQSEALLNSAAGSSALMNALKRCNIPVAMSHVEITKNIIEMIVYNQRTLFKGTRRAPWSLFVNRRVLAQNQHVTRYEP